jgi:hypothetical protein
MQEGPDSSNLARYESGERVDSAVGQSASLRYGIIGTLGKSSVHCSNFFKAIVCIDVVTVSISTVTVSGTRTMTAGTGFSHIHCMELKTRVLGVPETVDYVPRFRLK